MPSLTITETVQFNSQNYGVTRVVSAANETTSAPVGGVPAAQSGVLTTRTSGTAGTITMDSGLHTVTTGARIDVYWDGGAAYGATVGTVAGTSVPFTGAGGDALPAATTPVYVSLPAVETVSVVGNNAQALLVSSALGGSDRGGYVVYTQAGGTFIAAYPLTAVAPNNEWTAATNPFAGVTVGKVYFSHGNLTARNMSSTILFN